jgi:hypothetical protein
MQNKPNEPWFMKLENKPHKYEKYVVWTVAFIVIPGSSFFMVGYGIKKLWERWRKNV